MTHRSSSPINSLTLQQIRECREQFELLDRNQDGLVSATELYDGARELGYRYTKHDIEELLASSDLDGNGSMSFDEYLSAITSVMNKSTEERRRAELRLKFQKFDEDGNGQISMAEAHTVLQRELAFTPKQSIEFVRCYDVNGDGQLNYEEFVRFYDDVQQKSDQIHRLFVEFDRDQSGAISLDEAKILLARLNISGDEAEALVNLYDTNHDGQLQYGEFIAFLAHS